MVFDTVIHRNTKLGSAHFGETIIMHDADSKGATNYSQPGKGNSTKESDDVHGQF